MHDLRSEVLRWDTPLPAHLARWLSCSQPLADASCRAAAGRRPLVQPKAGRPQGLPVGPAAVVPKPAPPALQPPLPGTPRDVPAVSMSEQPVPQVCLFTQAVDVTPSIVGTQPLLHDSLWKAEVHT